jgi:hypothetical protein
MTDVFSLWDQRRVDVERHKENGARMAAAYARVDIVGQGTSEVEEMIDFGLTFVEQPFVSFGSYLDVDLIRDALDLDDDDDCPLPVVSGFVTRWDQDQNDAYTGAWVAVSVYFPPWDPVVPTDFDCELAGHFSFTAIAIKDIPLDKDDS